MYTRGVLIESNRRSLRACGVHFHEIRPEESGGGGGGGGRICIYNNADAVILRAKLYGLLKI